MCHIWSTYWNLFDSNFGFNDPIFAVGATDCSLWWDDPGHGTRILNGFITSLSMAIPSWSFLLLFVTIRKKVLLWTSSLCCWMSETLSFFLNQHLNPTFCTLKQQAYVSTKNNNNNKHMIIVSIYIIGINPIIDLEITNFYIYMWSGRVWLSWCYCFCNLITKIMGFFSIDEE